METSGVQIVDYGRGPQIAEHRLTVMDVYYYLERGYDFEFIHRAMPSLTRQQFDAVVRYVNQHRGELETEARRVEEFHHHGIAQQKAKGLHHEIDRSVSVEIRVERMKEKIRERPR